MLENHAGVCSEHEHDWCAIPLHEEAQICARCGQIEESQIYGASETEELETDLVACCQ
jgi:hypothetical protein